MLILFLTLKINITFFLTKLKIINYIQPNLGRLLVHNFPFNLNNFKLFKYYKCYDLKCKICSFSNKDYFLKFSNNFYLPIWINSNCNSKGIIYIIRCSLCSDVFYIGQSGRSVSERLWEHINDIKRLIFYILILFFFWIYFYF